MFISKKISRNIFISTKNFNKTKNFLNINKYSYIPYRFANCFYLNADSDDIRIFSQQEDIELIQANAHVQALSKEQLLEVNKVYAKLAILENENILETIHNLNENEVITYNKSELLHFLNQKVLKNVFSYYFLYSSTGITIEVSKSNFCPVAE